MQNLDKNGRSTVILAIKRDYLEGTSLSWIRAPLLQKFGSFYRFLLFCVNLEEKVKSTDKYIEKMETGRESHAVFMFR